MSTNSIHPTSFPIPGVFSSQGDPLEEETRPYENDSLSSQSMVVKASIPARIFQLCKDNQVVQVLGETMGIAAQICEMQQNGASQAVPFLAAAMTPLSLPNALKGAYERFKMVKSALKADYVVQGLLWTGKALDCVGTVIGNISKSLSGGFKIVGVAKPAATGILFTMCIPIILIVVGGIAAISQGGSLLRNVRALKEFNEKTKHTENDYKALSEALAYIQAPIVAKTVDTQTKEKAFVENRIFLEDHFRGNCEKENIQKRAKNVLANRHFKVIREYRKSLFSQFLGPLTLYNHSNANIHDRKNTIGAEIEELIGNIVSEQEFSDAELMAQLEAAYEKLSLFLKEPNVVSLCHTNKINIEQLKKDLEQNREDLISSKEGYLNRGNEVVDRMKSEIHRSILSNAVLLLVAAFVLASGVISFTPLNSRTLTYVLSFSSSGVTISYILFNKKVSQDQFYRIQKYFHMFPEREKKPLLLS